MDVISFVLCLGLFAIIGIWSSRRSSPNKQDYLLAERNVSPLLTALSAAATKYSGYIFIGLMGYVYTHGLSAIWIAFGFFFGDLIAFLFVHRKVSEATARTGALSFAELISLWSGGNYRILRVTVALITLVFLLTYAAAQFNAGSKALHVLFGWEYYVGSIVGAGVILTYCFTGGLRASIWTDAGQSVLMMFAMALLLVSAIIANGGISPFHDALNNVSPSFLDLGSERFGSFEAMALFGFGWLFNGIGVVGQPHIMVRFMALDNPDHIRKTGIIYFFWSGAFLLISITVGLAARLYIPDTGSLDAELVLPMLADVLLPGFAVGIIIGGVFAAAMSTADSQVLSCSAVLSEDFKIVGRGIGARRIATAIVVILSLVLGLVASANVFTLVIFAWSALACSIGPVVILLALGYRPSQATALIMMAVGMGVALLWRETGLNATVYEGFPGIVAALGVYVMALPFSTTSKERPKT